MNIRKYIANQTRTMHTGQPICPDVLDGVLLEAGVQSCDLDHQPCYAPHRLDGRAIAKLANAAVECAGAWNQQRVELLILSYEVIDAVGIRTSHWDGCHLAHAECLAHRVLEVTGHRRDPDWDPWTEVE